MQEKRLLFQLSTIRSTETNSGGTTTAQLTIRWPTAPTTIIGTESPTTPQPTKIRPK